MDTITGRAPPFARALRGESHGGVPVLFATFQEMQAQHLPVGPLEDTRRCRDGGLGTPPPRRWPVPLQDDPGGWGLDLGDKEEFTDQIVERRGGLVTAVEANVVPPEVVRENIHQVWLGRGADSRGGDQS